MGDTRRERAAKHLGPFRALDATGPEASEPNAARSHPLLTVGRFAHGLPSTKPPRRSRKTPRTMTCRCLDCFTAEDVTPTPRRSVSPKSDLFAPYGPNSTLLDTVRLVALVPACRKKKRSVAPDRFENGGGAPVRRQAPENFLSCPSTFLALKVQLVV